MTWVRIDDRFAQHPKVVAAGPLAMAMQVAALGYCNRELTDGFIPRAIAKTLLDFEIERDGKVYTIAFTCGMAGDDVTAAWVIAGLVESGMWEEVPGGYRIHDYHDYQPTKEQVLSEREQTKKRVSAWRERNAVTNSVTNADSNAVGTPSPTPVPVPTPVSRSEVSKPSVSHPPAGGRYTEEFEQFWKPYPPTNGSKADAFKAWKQLSPEDRAAAVAALPAWLGCDRWREGYVKHAGAWLRGRFWEVAPAGPRSNGAVTREVDPELLERLQREARALGAQEATS